MLLSLLVANARVTMNEGSYWKCGCAYWPSGRPSYSLSFRLECCPGLRGAASCGENRSAPCNPAPRSEGSLFLIDDEVSEVVSLPVLRSPLAYPDHGVVRPE